MPLTILSQLPAYDRPWPKIGCGLKFCFEETQYQVLAGTQSSLQIVLNLFTAVVAGDEINIHGYTFRFVSGTPTNLQEIQIGTLDDTATNLYLSMLQIPFFADNYVLNNSTAYLVTITSVKAQFDSNYSFSTEITNPSSIIINPFSTPTAGSNPINKEDYYVFFDIEDVDTGKRICMEKIFKPLNILANGQAKACIDIQGIIERYPELFTAPPLPYQTVLQGTNRPDNFDANYFRKFRLRVWNSYRDTNSSLPCDKVQSNLISIPAILGLRIIVANFMRKEDNCVNQNGFFPYSFPPLAAFGQRFITAMPTSYRICQKTAFEFRFDYPCQLINSLGGDTFLRVRVYFTDGTDTIITYTWDRLFDGCHVANISFGAIGSDATVQLAAPFDSKTIDRVEVSVFHVLFAVQNNFLEVKTVYYQTDDRAFVKCCDNPTNFYFLSSVGNNDVIVGKEIEQSLDIDFDGTCVEKKCCGTDYFGVAQYNSGKRATNIKEESKVHKVLIEASGEYLEEFLLSPFKWVYDRDKKAVYAIVPTQNSFKVWQKGFRNLIEFTYRKSLIQNHFKL
jgi:hypothetical protein